MYLYLYRTHAIPSKVVTPVREVALGSVKSLINIFTEYYNPEEKDGKLKTPFVGISLKYYKDPTVFLKDTSTNWIELLSSYSKLENQIFDVIVLKSFSEDQYLYNLVLVDENTDKILSRRLKSFDACFSHIRSECVDLVVTNGNQKHSIRLFDNKNVVYSIKDLEMFLYHNTYTLSINQAVRQYIMYKLTPSTKEFKTFKEDQTEISFQVTYGHLVQNKEI